MIVMPSLAHMRPNCVSGLMPASASRDVGWRSRSTTPWERVPRLRARPRPRSFPGPRNGTAPHRSRTSQTGFRAAFLVVRTVELNQLAEVRFALAPGAMRLALATAAPQTRGEHEQCFARHFQAVVGCRCSDARRPELHSSRAPTPLIGSVRSTADVTVHQSLGPARTVTLLQTLRMAVADLQQLGGGFVPLVSLGSALRRASTPWHSSMSFPLSAPPSEPQSRGISIGRSWGHYHWASTGNHRIRPKFFCCQ